MGCMTAKEALPKSVKRKKGDSDGYTVDKFVRQTLVPVKGICCRAPADPEKQEELVAHVAAINRSLNNDEEANTWSFDLDLDGDDDENSKKKIPEAAVCRVHLEEAHVEGDVHQCFDFNQEAKLQVRVFGSLFFPPNLDPEDAEQRSEITEIKVEIWTVLERYTEHPVGRESERCSISDRGSVSDRMSIQDSAMTGGGLASAPQLRVNCLHMLVETDEEKGGDAMIEAWLPVRDVLEDCARLLTWKLDENMRSVTEEGE